MRISLALPKLSSNKDLELQDLNILCTKLETTERLYLVGAKAWKFITNPVSDGFLYHVDDDL